MNGHKDLIGDVSAKVTGLTSPTLHNFQGNFRGWFYKPGNRADITYHIPHDYAPGTNLYMHVHWAYNGAKIDGFLNMTHHVAYSKGGKQMIFGKEIPINVIVDCTDMEPLIHNIADVQISDVSNPLLLDTSLIEPDGIITNCFIINDIPKIDGDIAMPMIICVDIHYTSV